MSIRQAPSGFQGLYLQTLSNKRTLTTPPSSPTLHLTTAFSSTSHFSQLLKKSFALTSLFSSHPTCCFITFLALGKISSFLATTSQNTPGVPPSPSSYRSKMGAGLATSFLSHGIKPSHPQSPNVQRITQRRSSIPRSLNPPTGRITMNNKKSDELLIDHNHDGVDRRGFLNYMACAATVTLCVLQRGVLKSFSLTTLSEPNPAPTHAA